MDWVEVEPPTGQQTYFLATKFGLIYIICSQFCCRMAASGKVILAIEHRDGTGPVCMPRSWNLEGKSEPRTLFYLRETDIQYALTCVMNVMKILTIDL
jgi:hypothetical protein